MKIKVIWLIQKYQIECVGKSCLNQAIQSVKNWIKIKEEIKWKLRGCTSPVDCCLHAYCTTFPGDRNGDVMKREINEHPASGDSICQAIQRIKITQDWITVGESVMSLKSRKSAQWGPKYNYENNPQSWKKEKTILLRQLRGTIIV